MADRRSRRDQYTLDYIRKIVEDAYAIYAPETKSDLYNALKIRYDTKGSIIPDLSGLDVKVLKTSGEARISFYIDLAAHPEARALEYGSGVAPGRLRKAKSKNERANGYILIKGNPFLTFEWQTRRDGVSVDKEALRWSRIAFWNKRRKGEVSGLPQYAGETTDGKLLFNYVLHPGVSPYKGRGYLKYSVAQAAPKVAKFVGQEAADEIQKAVRNMRKFIPKSNRLVEQ